MPNPRRSLTLASLLLVAGALIAFFTGTRNPPPRRLVLATTTSVRPPERSPHGGGDIEGYTRVMTTAIVLETRKGNFELATALGLLLLGISFAVNLTLQLLQPGIHGGAP